VHFSSLFSLFTFNFSLFTFHPCRAGAAARRYFFLRIWGNSLVPWYRAARRHGEIFSQDLGKLLGTGTERRGGAARFFSQDLGNFLGTLVPSCGSGDIFSRIQTLAYGNHAARILFACLFCRGLTLRPLQCVLKVLSTPQLNFSKLCKTLARIACPYPAHVAHFLGSAECKLWGQLYRFPFRSRLVITLKLRHYIVAKKEKT